MMYDEFMEIAGYRVAYSDYKNIIEPMYNSIPENLTKYDFVKMIDRKHFDVDAKLKKNESNIKNIIKFYNSSKAFSEEREAAMKDLEKAINDYIAIIISMDGFFCSEISFRIDSNWNENDRIYRIVFFNEKGNHKFHFFIDNNNKIFKEYC